MCEKVAKMLWEMQSQADNFLVPFYMENYLYTWRTVFLPNLDHGEDFFFHAYLLGCWLNTYTSTFYLQIRRLWHRLSQLYLCIIYYSILGYLTVSYWRCHSLMSMARGNLKKTGSYQSLYSKYIDFFRILRQISTILSLLYGNTTCVYRD